MLLILGKVSTLLFVGQVLIAHGHRGPDLKGQFLDLVIFPSIPTKCDPIHISENRITEKRGGLASDRSQVKVTALTVLWVCPGPEDI